MNSAIKLKLLMHQWHRRMDIFHQDKGVKYVHLKRVYIWTMKFSTKNEKLLENGNENFKESHM